MPAATPLLAIDWRPPRGVRVACTTRAGGVSAAPWNGFNLGDHVGDPAACVAQNRQALVQLLDLPSPPRWLRQVHGVVVADLDDAAAAATPEADAAVTTRAGTVAVILTADCLPVLFAAADGSAVAAAHAGWRGLAAGVLENTVSALRARAPGVPLQAWLGPAISARHFEVGADVRDAFLRADPGATAAFVSGRDGHWQADLAALARQRLARLDVQVSGGGNRCTYAEEADFFSHRRDVQHRRLAATGRMAALIWRQA